MLGAAVARRYVPRATSHRIVAPAFVDVEAGEAVAHRPPLLTSRYTGEPRLDTPSLRVRCRGR